MYIEPSMIIVDFYIRAYQRAGLGSIIIHIVATQSDQFWTPSVPAINR